MKKIFISLATIVLVMNVGTVNAQEQPRFRNEVSVGAGVLSNSDILNFAANIAVSVLTLGGYTSRNMHWTGTWHASYKNLISKHSAVGGTLAYCGNSADAYLGNTMKGHLRSSYWTVAAEYDLRYINTPSFNLYSTIGLGATIYHQSYKSQSSSDNDGKATLGYFDFQLGLLGFRVGNRWGAFGEFGVGYKGMLNGGLFVRF